MLAAGTMLEGLGEAIATVAFGVANAVGTTVGCADGTVVGEGSGIGVAGGVVGDAATAVLLGKVIGVGGSAATGLVGGCGLPHASRTSNTKISKPTVSRTGHLIVGLPQAIAHETSSSNSLFRRFWKVLAR